MNSTRSFNINVIRSAVGLFQDKHGGFGDVTVTPSHFDTNTYEPMGYAESNLVEPIVEVGQIAERLEAERKGRFVRQAEAHELFTLGKISWDEFENVLNFG